MTENRKVVVSVPQYYKPLLPWSLETSAWHLGETFHWQERGWGLCQKEHKSISGVFLENDNPQSPWHGEERERPVKGGLNIQGCKKRTGRQHSGENYKQRGIQMQKRGGRKESNPKEDTTRRQKKSHHHSRFPNMKYYS